jgi:hypothetical protein
MGTPRDRGVTIGGDVQILFHALRERLVAMKADG